MVTVFCEAITPRITYTVDLVFSQLLQVKYALTSDPEVLAIGKHAKLCYGNQPGSEGLFFRASGLLAEEDIREQTTDVGELMGHPALFKVEGPSALSHDLFSAIFYMVSRYEEYLPHEKDEHGRYIGKQSIAYKNKFLELPVVDIWALLIGQQIKQRYPEFETGAREYHYVNTIDIDNAFAYSGKGSLRAVGGIAKAALKLDKEDMVDRVGVMSGGDKDPYDTYSYMKQMAETYASDVKSFILLGNYGPYDKNLPHSSDKQIEAVQKMAEFTEVGMHPSYGSEGNLQQLKEEKKRLEEILKEPVKISRQHYLKLKLPETYKHLIACGIEADYSMGYGELIGFRAGTCTPFRFFNLISNGYTSLMIYPFAVMDRTLIDYLKLSPKQAIDRITSLVDEVRKVNGTFISVWHNESLSDKREWSGWLPVYEHLQKSSVL